MGEPAEALAQRGVRRRLLLGLALTLILVAGVSVTAARLTAPNAYAPPGPLVVAAADQPGASTRACSALLKALPVELAGRSRRTLVEPLAGVLAWGDPATTLRCGVPTPDELTCSAYLIQVNTVSWLQLSDVGRTGYLAADRSVRIAVIVPDGSGTAGLQQISEVIARTLPTRPPCRQGVLQPTDDG